MDRTSVSIFSVWGSTDCCIINGSNLVKHRRVSSTGATFGATISRLKQTMASVRRVPRSPFWIAKFRDGDTVTFRSTKQKNKSDALRIALEWERLAKEANKGEITQAAVIKFANELLDKVGQDSIGKISTQTFATEWLKRGSKADTTRKRYESVIQGFLKFIGPKRANATVASITADEVERFRDQEMAQGKTASTADFGVKVLRAMFESARKKNQRLDNPADGVESIRVNQQERQAFSDEQLALLLANADSEWKGMILLGAFGGLRLNDAANIRWDQLDLTQESLTFMPAKTALRSGKNITVALHTEVVNYLKMLPKPKKAAGPVLPSLAGKKSGSAGGLSNQFAALLVKTGIRASSSKNPKEKKTTLGRKFNALGFHSTRHYFISKLTNADVPTVVSKALAGHSADDAHSRYIHLEVETQKRALDKIRGPGLGQGITTKK